VIGLFLPPASNGDSELIYRQGPQRPKSLSLHRPQDWRTGLSFTDAAPVGTALMFRTSRLTTAGFVVRPDGGELVSTLWSGEPLIDPRTGQQAIFPEHHVTVYHSDRDYWDRWHEVDRANKGLPNLSPQLLALYALREG
jgi:hypothetical protein